MSPIALDYLRNTARYLCENSNVVCRVETPPADLIPWLRNRRTAYGRPAREDNMSLTCSTVIVSLISPLTGTLKPQSNGLLYSRIPNSLRTAQKYPVGLPFAKSTRFNNSFK